MRPTRIEIEIDEVVLRGFPALDCDAVATAMQAELSRLVGERWPRDAPVADVAVAARDGGRFPLPSGRREHRIGTRLARATFRATTEAAERRAVP